MMILEEDAIRSLSDITRAREVMRDAFHAQHRGEATTPNIISMPFRDPEGVAHIKVGHVHADPTGSPGDERDLPIQRLHSRDQSK